MKFIKLETKEQFENLKKGDIVIVDWVNDETPLEAYKIHGIIEGYDSGKELILNKKRNHYIIISLYLAGKSKAREAWLITKAGG